MTTILGLNSGEYNSSACILKNGKVIFSVQEERLNREKFTKKFPIKSIEECLKFSNLKICIDTEGAQIRTKVSKNKYLKKGQKISIHLDKGFHLYPSDVFKKLKKNDQLEVGFDGLILKILKTDESSILSQCIQAGSLEKNKGVHLSNRKVKLNYLTEKDLEAIKVGKKYNIKNYALSFTNSVSDVIKFTKLFKYSSSHN